MTKIKHFRKDIEVEMGMTGKEVHKKAKEVEARICKEFDDWRNNNPINIITIKYERNIAGRYIEEDLSVSLHVIYDEDRKEGGER